MHTKHCYTKMNSTKELKDLLIAGKQNKMRMVTKQLQDQLRKQNIVMKFLEKHFHLLCISKVQFWRDIQKLQFY